MVVAYAPCSGVKLEVREAFRGQVGSVQEQADGYAIVVVGGDLNAEVGNNVDGRWKGGFGFLWGAAKNTDREGVVGVVSRAGHVCSQR